MNRYQLRRREILKALGLAGLPLMLEGRARAAAGQRLICVAQTGGYVQASWRPPVGTFVSPLPASCAPLQPYADQLTFLPDLTLPRLATGESSYGRMFHGSGGFSADRLTIDQVVGAGVARAVSLPLAVQVTEERGANPDLSHAFFASSGAPVEPQNNPFAAWTSLFGGATAGVPPARLLLERKSVLDLVSRNLAQFRVMVGRDERMNIDAHLDAVRSLESQLTGFAPSASATCTTKLGAEIDVNAPANYAALVKLQMRLGVMALSCGVTSVVTLQLSDSAATNVFPLPGAASWGAIARDTSAAGLDSKRLVDQWCMQQLADLLLLLSATPDGAVTLLDTTLVLWANSVDDGRSRNPQKLPWILAGRAGGTFRGGQCANSAGQPASAVLAEVCNALGVQNHPFGTPLAGLRP
jgi:hypothetical protein